MNSKLIYDVNTKSLSITNKPMVEDTDFYINLIDDEDDMYVMLIEERIAVNSTLEITTIENFYKLLHEYTEDKEMTGKYVVKITNMSSEKYVVRGIYHLFGPELCNFCLYKIRKQRCN
jgi:hypothetical protein